tara:strand:- start:2913 stop:3563 length:651 start_codon:yes stop_codon:yes gene_type:complete
MPDYATWVASGGWDTECPRDIPQKIWESFGKQKYRLECQYRSRGRSWAAFIRDLPDDVVERLCNDVAQWTTDYSDHMGSTDTVQDLVALHYSSFIPLFTLQERKIEDLPTTKNVLFSFILRNKGISLIERNLIDALVGEYNITEEKAKEILEWSESVSIGKSKVRELVGFAIHRRLFNIRHSRTYTKLSRTREGGRVKTRSKNADKASQAFQQIKR